MNLFSRAFYFFTPYSGARERAVGQFFKSLTENSNKLQTRDLLGSLLQQNIAVINLWTEYRYKGYKYLRKSERKKLYANLRLIADDFARFYASSAPPAEAVLARVREVAPHAVVDANKAVLLQALMDYFSPRRGVYEYRESSSFGRLLRNPAHEKLVGDCNQIVTLYIFLYSRYFDVRDLQVRVLPTHVALHYGGVDIEATAGTFANYGGQKDNRLLPVEEIVSINLLDTTDAYLAKHEIAAEDLLQASRFAYVLSHDRDIVARNLEAAYSQLVSSLLKRNNYAKALEFAREGGDRELLSIVGHNGAVYEMGRHNFAAARRFAEYAKQRDELVRGSWQAEAAHHYEARRYHDAIRAFEHTGDQVSVRRCYEALFFAEQEKLGKSLTSESIKQHAGTIKRMRDYAQKSGNKQLADHADSLNKYL